MLAKNILTQDSVIRLGKSQLLPSEGKDILDMCNFVEVLKLCQMKVTLWPTAYFRGRKRLMTSVSCDKRWSSILYSRLWLEFRLSINCDDGTFSWPALLENLSLFLLGDYPILAKYKFLMFRMFATESHR